MNKCKDCGREEMGYGSLLDEDGYCFRCGVVHNKEKIRSLERDREILKSFIVRHKPEMSGWIIKNFGKTKEER